MRQWRTGVLLYRWFGIGCVIGCVLMNLLLDDGCPDTVRAMRVIMEVMDLVARFFRHFSLVAVGMTVGMAVCLAGLRRMRRGRLWLSLIALAAGAVYACVAVILVRGMKMV